METSKKIINTVRKRDGTMLIPWNSRGQYCWVKVGSVAWEEMTLEWEWGTLSSRVLGL